MGTDDLRIDGPEGLEGQTEFVGYVASQVGGNRVRGSHQVVEDGQAVGLGEIEGQALLVAVIGVKELRILRREKIGPDLAGEVATVVGVFDLDHLGTLVGQELSPEGPGAVLLDRQDTDAIQR